MPPSAVPDPATVFLEALWCGLGGEPQAMERVIYVPGPDLPSVFATSALGAASVAAVGLAAAELVAAAGHAAPSASIDWRRTALWFQSSIAPQGWQIPPIWDAVAGDYATADGWIRLHTNAAHHRAAALRALGLDADADRARVAVAVGAWSGTSLEAAVVAEGGVAAQMRSLADWRVHPQGAAVAAEPQFHLHQQAGGRPDDAPLDPARPLAGVKVLDLTRILAGPIATRALAGLGAQVLRLDPPGWDEPSVAPDVTLGKRCARLDLKSAAGRARFLDLLAQADVVIQGYRPSALDALDLGAAVRQAARPGLIDIALDAYGWTGPWAGRRGYDSLVQMSAGIARAGMCWRGADRPFPLPVQALDHATGYALAAAALRGLAERRRTGAGLRAFTSLAKTADLLTRVAATPAAAPFPKPRAEDYQSALEQTEWGPAHRLKAPLKLGGRRLQWDRPAGRLGSSDAVWLG
ncbi:MAG: CoA transferase [Pseudomonadota bacterium]